MARSTFYRALLLSVGLITLAWAGSSTAGLRRALFVTRQQQHNKRPEKTRSDRSLCPITSVLILYTIHMRFLKRELAGGLGPCRPWAM